LVVSDEEAMMPISATRREVAAQPEVMLRVLDELAGPVRALADLLAARGTRQILLVGSGDSWFAGMACRLAFEQYAGLEAEAVQAYEFAAHGRPSLDAATAVVVISSSGRPTTTWDALDRALKTPAYVIGITDKPYPGNPFNERVHTALVPGAEKVGWPAQTTTATIALLSLLAIELGHARGALDADRANLLREQLRAIPAAARTVLDDSAAWAEELARGFLAGGQRRIYTFVGSGPSLGVAYTGMALLAEGPQEVGIAIAAEEFHHGLHIATIARDDVVVVVAPTGAGSARMLDTARSVQAWGAQLVAIVDGQDQAIRGLAGATFELPSVPEPFSPLLSLLPLHQLSIQLAALKVASGYQRPRSVP
jgi:glucosamine 6-phosphate synthetase-like amidotransferase/phosphosugar isomerase protein